MTAASRSELRRVITTLGLLQILAWGSSFYLLGVLSAPIARDTGWPLSFVVGGASLAMLLAGMVSPAVGRAIQGRGGRPILAASSILFAIGLVLLATASNLVLYFLAWAVLGLGMATGLYDPVFATLGRQYGPAARRMITLVTLFGGFASTVSWPLLAWLLGHFGWRTTCLAFAGLNALLGLPAYLILLPPRPPPLALDAGPSRVEAAELPAERQKAALVLLGAILTIGAATLSLVSMHLLTLLRARGLDLATAVSLGAVVGPSQVAARVVELVLGRHFHPVWTMLAGAVMVAAGMLLLWAGAGAGAPFAAVALIAYGAGNGISSIVRGTVPLVLFGPARYALLMGRLGLPILFAMAVAPALGAFLVEHGGATVTFGAVAVAALANVGLVLALARWCRAAPS